jgi:hypothetical protein
MKADKGQWFRLEVAGSRTPTSYSTALSSNGLGLGEVSIGIVTMNRNWELMATWNDAKLQVPTLYIVGDRDLVYRFPGMAALHCGFAPELDKIVLLGGTDTGRSAEIVRFLRFQAL